MCGRGIVVLETTATQEMEALIGHSRCKDQRGMRHRQTNMISHAVQSGFIDGNRAIVGHGQPWQRSSQPERQRSGY